MVLRCARASRARELRYNPDKGHVMMQLPGGVPVVIPMQAIGGGAAAQVSHQSMVLVLSSDALLG